MLRSPHDEERIVNDPVKLIVAMTIKQAVDDYREGFKLRKNLKRIDEYKRFAVWAKNIRKLKRETEVMKQAIDGEDFLNGDRLVRYLRIINMDETVNVNYIRKKAMEDLPRKSNTITML